MTALCNARLVLQDAVVTGDIVIDSGRIQSVFVPPAPHDCRCIDLCGLYLCPGFIDIHVHGGGGHDFMDASLRAFREASAFHLSHGTTTMFPTTMACPLDELFEVFSAFRQAKPVCVSRLEGLHLEGPYVSPEQTGAQDPSYLHLPGDGSLEEILEKGAGAVRIWTIAPELPGAGDLIRRAVENGIAVSLGHSSCTGGDVLRAQVAGASMVTHLFSSMSTITRVHGVRVPGLLESALVSDSLYVELIADGMHVPPELIRLVLRTLPPDHIVLVTDAMRAAGQQSGKSVLGSLRNGQEVEVDGHVARMPGSESFAGSIATADVLLRTMAVTMGLPLHSAVSMLTANPAEALGLHDRGRLCAGLLADFVILDDRLNVRQVYVGGRPAAGDVS